MSSDAVFSRRLSLSDLAYIASGYRKGDNHQVVCHLMVEGEGEIPEQELARAVQIAACSNPVIRMRMAGFWGCKYWRADGPLPKVSTLYQEWDGQYNPDLEFIDSSLDLIEGPVAEIVQVVGTRTYIMFRIHHGVTDGMGIIEFATAVFDALNQRKPQSYLSRIRLEDLPEGNFYGRPPVVKRAVPPFSIADASERNIERSRLWQRLTIPGKDSRILLRTILAIARVALANEQGPVRILVPVSLRRHVPEKQSSANLVGMVRLDITEQDNLRTLARQFGKKLDSKEELPVAVRSVTSRLTFWVPLFLLRALERILVNAHLKSARFGSTATVSSIGTQELHRFTYGQFIPSSVIGFPVPPLGTPLVILLSSNENQSELVLSVSRGLSDAAGLDKLTQRIAQELKNAK